MHATLFSSAVSTRLDDLIVSRSPSHVPGCASRWLRRLMVTLLAPMISRRRRGRFPSCSWPQSLFANGQVLPRHETEQGRKIPGLAERLRRRRKRRYGRGDQRPNAWHRHEPSGDVVLFGALGNPGIEFRYLRFELSQCPVQGLQ